MYRAYDSMEGVEVAWNSIRLTGIPEAEKKRIQKEVQVSPTSSDRRALFLTCVDAGGGRCRSRRRIASPDAARLGSRATCLPGFPPARPSARPPTFPQPLATVAAF